MTSSKVNILPIARLSVHHLFWYIDSLLLVFYQMLLILLNQDPISKVTLLNAKVFLVERATSVKCCPALSME